MYVIMDASVNVAKLEAFEDKTLAILDLTQPQSSHNSEMTVVGGFHMDKIILYKKST